MILRGPLSFLGNMECTTPSSSSAAFRILLARSEASPLTVVLHCHSPATVCHCSRGIQDEAFSFTLHPGLDARAPENNSIYRKGKARQSHAGAVTRALQIKWPTVPAGNPRGWEGLYLAQKPRPPLGGLPDAPQQQTVTGQSNPGPRLGGRHSWSLAPSD